MKPKPKLNLPKLFDKIYKIKKARGEPSVFRFEFPNKAAANQFDKWIEEMKAKHGADNATYQWLALGQWSDKP